MIGDNEVAAGDKTGNDKATIDDNNNKVEAKAKTEKEVVHAAKMLAAPAELVDEE